MTLLQKILANPEARRRLATRLWIIKRAEKKKVAA
jgi:hypothetical protein